MTLPGSGIIFTVNIQRTKMAAKPKMIVIAAFDEGEDGELLPAFAPREMETEERATYMAKILGLKHKSVIAWSRSADPNIGDYGEPKVLYQRGELPEME